MGTFNPSDWVRYELTTGTYVQVWDPAAGGTFSGCGIWTCREIVSDGVTAQLVVCAGDDIILIDSTTLCGAQDNASPPSQDGCLIGFCGPVGVMPALEVVSEPGYLGVLWAPFGQTLILEGVVAGCILEPSVAINALIDDVAELVTTGALKEPHGRALTNKLVSALKQLDKDNTASVIDMLQGVIDQLAGLTAARHVDGAVADALISDAQAVIDVLQSPAKGSVPALRASVEESTWSIVKRLYR
jgi:hypothetical protein